VNIAFIIILFYSSIDAAQLFKYSLKVDNIEIDKLKDPFIKYKTKQSLKKKSLKKKVKFKLSAIMNNSARINNRWCKNGYKIKNYTITAITKNSVILEKENQKIILSLKER